MIFATIKGTTRKEPKHPSITPHGGQDYTCENITNLHEKKSKQQRPPVNRSMAFGFWLFVTKSSQDGRSGIEQLVTLSNASRFVNLERIKASFSDQGQQIITPEVW